MKRVLNVPITNLERKVVEKSCKPAFDNELTFDGLSIVKVLLKISALLCYTEFLKNNILKLLFTNFY